MAGEAQIIINGKPLSAAQAQAVRVAVTDFQAHCSKPTTRRELGNLADAYRDRLLEVMAKMGVGQ